MPFAFRKALQRRQGDRVVQPASSVLGGREKGGGVRRKWREVGDGGFRKFENLRGVAKSGPELVIWRGKRRGCEASEIGSKMSNGMGCKSSGSGVVWGRGRGEGRDAAEVARHGGARGGRRAILSLAPTPRG